MKFPVLQAESLQKSFSVLPQAETLVGFLSICYIVNMLWTILGFGILGNLEGGAGERLLRITHGPLPSRQSHRDLKNLTGGGSFRIQWHNSQYQ